MRKCATSSADAGAKNAKKAKVDSNNEEEVEKGKKRGGKQEGKGKSKSGKGGKAKKMR